MTECNFKYGDEKKQLTIPEDQILQTIIGNEIPALKDLAGKVREVLSNTVRAKNFSKT